ncbi:hypothetical protein L873DRAFT_481825 [Choiromyces venosus 120613-1]|uniref:Uncharacterized protein n=1 Tax=Choiromyces venosus 120613-1 TaxID=1336337 RepID=A0A3N4JV30_9PEZI|nr:hypothetical protein L873DRAFT_481825 [Choiromyces venosus 120613-1]
MINNDLTTLIFFFFFLFFPSFLSSIHQSIQTTLTNTDDLHTPPTIDSTTSQKKKNTEKASGHPTNQPGRKVKIQ